MDIAPKLKPMKFIFGHVVYEIKPEAFLKDVVNGGILTAPPEKPKSGEDYDGGCLYELRPSDDREVPPGVFSEASRYLMGNTFLKNFVSVYDFDQ